MSVWGGVLALTVALGLTACTGASGREPGPPDRAVALEGCGPVRYDDVRGPAPHAAQRASSGYGFVGVDFHHCFSGPRSPTVKCRCGAVGLASPVLPT